MYVSKMATNTAHLNSLFFKDVTNLSISEQSNILNETPNDIKVKTNNDDNQEDKESNTKNNIVYRDNEICSWGSKEYEEPNILIKTFYSFYDENYDNYYDDDSNSWNSEQNQLDEILQEITNYEDKKNKCWGCQKKGLKYRKTCKCYDKQKCSNCGEHWNKCSQEMYCDDNPIY
jgi:hypothetical protein